MTEIPTSATCPFVDERLGDLSRLLLNLSDIHVSARIKTVVAFTILRHRAGVWNRIARLGARSIDNAPRATPDRLDTAVSLMEQAGLFTD
jgi:hypothetical protein